MKPEPLSAKESAKLRRMWNNPRLPIRNAKKFFELNDRSLLYGDNTITEQPFVGLEPRIGSSSRTIPVRR